MKNILFVSHSAELNGAELWLLETLRGLDRGKYLPMLVVPRPGPLAEAARALGVATRVVSMKWSITEKSRLWRQPFAALWNVASVARIGRIIRGERIDLVFTNSAAVASGARAARRAGVPHVWAIHEVLGGDAPFLRSLRGPRALTAFIAAASAMVIVNSKLTGSAFRDGAKVVLVPNGLDIKPGVPGRREALRSELGLEAGDFAAGIVGKIYEGKGQREAVRATAHLAPRHPGFKLLVIGDVRDEAYARSLREFVAANGLERHVLFLGYRPDLGDVLKLLNAVVVASVVESFGRAALEGTPAGVPVLAVRAGGLTEIVRPGDNGFLMDSRAPEDIARGLEYIIGNPEAAAAAVEGGYRTIREEYSLEKQIRGVERVLADVLGAA
jgi:glycosyltransferase involved in cell wall biosynthesis